MRNYYIHTGHKIYKVGQAGKATLGKSGHLLSTTEDIYDHDERQVVHDEGQWYNLLAKYRAQNH